MLKVNFNLIAIDVIDGLDNNFYVVDINGLISVQPSIIKWKNEFYKSLNQILESNYHFQNNDEILDFHMLNEGLNSDAKYIIHNVEFPHENKLNWRKKYNLKCPKVGSDFITHNLPDYPKFLYKPKYSYGGIGILLYNDSEIFLPKDDYFIEQFIPSKLIDGHCYHSRLVMITNSKKTYPVFQLNKLCGFPIINNLKKGILSEKESLSYISNKFDESNPNYLHEKMNNSHGNGYGQWRLNTDLEMSKFAKEVANKIQETNLQDLTKNGDIDDDMNMLEYLSKF